MSILFSVVAFLAVSPAADFDWSNGICYAPTNFNPKEQIYPSVASIEADLEVLFGGGFRGICTYESKEVFREVPRIAKQIGFNWVIMGVWDPTNTDEVAAAIAESAYVDGYCVNNEGLKTETADCAYDTTVLAATMDAIRVATNKPVTTTEEAGDYLKGDALASWLFRNSDWVFPNCHPYWAGITNPTEAVAFVVGEYQDLCALTDRPVIIKETGLPSDGCAECSENNQMQFWEQLAGASVEYLSFEGFDQYWKGPEEVEPHWGFYDRYRNPKLLTPVRRTSWSRVKTLFR